MISKQYASNGPRKLVSAGLCMVAMVAVVAAGMSEAAARGGGGRGGGGGHMAKSSVSGANRSMSRPQANMNSANRANVGNNMNSGNRANVGNNVSNGNRANLGNNVNSGNRVNNGNINIGNDVNVDIDRGYGHGYGHGYHGGYYHHPVAAGIAIGAVAVTTAAVLGSYYRTLPPSCTVVYKNGASYHYCGSVYYQQTWSGNDVVYVVVQP